MEESKFLKIICPRCKTLQITFGKASTRVKCQSCNKLLLKTGGGKARIKAQIKEIIT